MTKPKPPIIKEMTPERRYYARFYMKLNLILVALLALLWWLNNVVFS